MEIKGKVHCLFEQSGTFKNEFIKLGIPAEDYDIQNNFGQTDHIIDIFHEIEEGYEGRPSIFDGMDKDDLIMAFFPCVYFCENNSLYFRGKHMNLVKLSTKDKYDCILDRSRNRQHFYELALKLFAICEVSGLRLVTENPYSEQHFFYNNFPHSPAIIDKNRTLRGDFYAKPTQYFFVNCKPTKGFTYQLDKKKKVIEQRKSSNKAGLCSEERSMISPDYARNFICDFILGKSQPEIDAQLF